MTHVALVNCYSSLQTQPNSCRPCYWENGLFHFNTYLLTVSWNNKSSGCTTAHICVTICIICMLHYARSHDSLVGSVAYQLLWHTFRGILFLPGFHGNRKRETVLSGMLATWQALVYWRRGLEYSLTCFHSVTTRIQAIHTSVEM